MSIKIDKNSIYYKNGIIRQANVRFEYKGYTVSLAIDDSCGNSQSLFRGDFLIFKGDEDVTQQFYPGFTSSSIIPASSEELKNIFLAIDNMLAKA